MEFGEWLRLLGLMNLILFLSHLISIQGRELYLYDLKPYHWFVIRIY